MSLFSLQNISYAYPRGEAVLHDVGERIVGEQLQLNARVERQKGIEPGRDEQPCRQPRSIDAQQAGRLIVRGAHPLHGKVKLIERWRHLCQQLLTRFGDLVDRVSFYAPYAASAGAFAPAIERLRAA